MSKYTDSITSEVSKNIDELLGKKKKATPKEEKPSAPPPAWFDSEEDDDVELLTFAEFTNGEGSVPSGVKDTRIWPKPRPASDWDESVISNIPTPLKGFVYTDQVYYMFLGIKNKYNVFAVGGAGTGKDTAAKQYAALAGIPYWRITGMAGTTPDMILGRKSLNEKGTDWEPGDAEIWARNGGLMVLSEPAAMPPDSMFAFQPALEEDGHLNLMDHPDPNERMLKVHEDAVCVLTSNVRGTGDNVHKHGATMNMDDSTRNRMEWWVQFNYWSVEKEVAHMLELFPKLHEELAKKIVQLGNLLRSAYDNDVIKTGWSMRNIKPFCQTTLQLKNPAEAFKATFFDSLDDEEKSVVRKHWQDVDFREFKL